MRNKEHENLLLIEVAIATCLSGFLATLAHMIGELFN
jgi:hypothetical protein